MTRSAVRTNVLSVTCFSMKSAKSARERVRISDRIAIRSAISVNRDQPDFFRYQCDRFIQGHQTFGALFFAEGTVLASGRDGGWLGTRPNLLRQEAQRQALGRKG